MAVFQIWTGLAFLTPAPPLGENSGLACSGVLYDDPGALRKRVLVTVGMYLFSVAYSPGAGPVPFVYSAESMPLVVCKSSHSYVCSHYLPANPICERYVTLGCP